MKKLLLLLFFPLTVFAQEEAKEMFKKGVDTTGYVPTGLQIGDRAPEIIGTSIHGEKVNSNDILKEKNIVLIFYRGEWCPVCNRYLSNLNDSLKYIVEKNAKVLVIGPETFENAEKTVEKTNAGFTLIPDTSLQILKDYDVLFKVTKRYERKIKTFLLTDIAKSNNQEEATLPVPATYIINREGIIQWRHFDYNYSVRASAMEIIENIK